MEQPSLNATARQPEELNKFLSDALNRLDIALSNLSGSIDALDQRTAQFRVISQVPTLSEAIESDTFGGSSVSQSLDTLYARVTDSVNRINNIIYSLDS